MSRAKERGIGIKVRSGNGRTTEQGVLSGELTQEEKERLYFMRHKQAVIRMQESEKRRLGRELTELDEKRIEVVVTAGEVIEDAKKPPLEKVVGESFRDADTRELLTVWYAAVLAETLHANRQESPLIQLKLNRSVVAQVYDEYKPGLIDTLDSLDLTRIRHVVQSMGGRSRRQR